LVDPASLFTQQGNGLIYFTFHLRRLKIRRVLDITTTESGMEARCAAAPAGSVSLYVGELV
jgi:hypothetical protein